MDPALAISDSNSMDATDSGASRGLLIPCTKSATKQKRKVKAVVVDNKKEIGKMVENLKKKDTNGDLESVIGFQVVYARSFGSRIPLSGQKIRISHLILSNGSIAYVVFLGTEPTLAEPLMQFLLDPGFTFVCMGMEQHNANLEILYETGCTNACDLGQLAAGLKGNPRLRSCGIDMLAEGIGLSETPRPSKVVCKKGSDKPYRVVNKDKMLEAVANTCVFQEIGKILLCS